MPGRRARWPAATRADLAAVRAFVGRACAALGCGGGPCDGLVLAADEVCTNVLAHAYAGAPGPLVVGVDGATGAGCRVTVADAGPPFDPTRDPRALRTPNATAPADDRPDGGLGWFLVRQSVAAVSYARCGAINVVTLTGRAPAAAPPPSPSPPAPPMDISIAHERDVTVVAVAGSLDALTADTLADALDAQVRAGRTRLVAALDGVDYTSSAGLRVLLATVRDARRRGGDLRVAGAQERVQRVLALSGFTTLLRCFPDVPGAVASWDA